MVTHVPSENLESAVDQHRPIPYGHARMAFCVIGLFGTWAIVKYFEPVIRHVGPGLLVVALLVYGAGFAYAFRPFQWLDRNVFGYALFAKYDSPDEYTFWIVSDSETSRNPYYPNNHDFRIPLRPRDRSSWLRVLSNRGGGSGSWSLDDLRFRSKIAFVFVQDPRGSRVDVDLATLARIHHATTNEVNTIYLTDLLFPYNPALTRIPESRIRPDQAVS